MAESGVVGARENTVGRHAIGGVCPLMFALRSQCRLTSAMTRTVRSAQREVKGVAVHRVVRRRPLHHVLRFLRRGIRLVLGDLGQESVSVIWMLVSMVSSMASACSAAVASSRFCHGISECQVRLYFSAR